MGCGQNQTRREDIPLLASANFYLIDTCVIKSCQYELYRSQKGPKSVTPPSHASKLTAMFVMGNESADVSIRLYQNLGCVPGGHFSPGTYT